MSATGRGPRGGGGRDFFATPGWCVDRLFEAVPEIVVPAGTYLEPCAGDGAIVRAAERHVTGARWDLSDIDPKSARIRPADIRARLAQAVSGEHRVFDRGITNPPFPLTLEVCDLFDRTCGSWAVLIRLNWLESGPRNRDRGQFLRAVKPGIVVLPDRPSFDGVGTDACAYGWLVGGIHALQGRWLMGRDTDGAAKKQARRIARESR